MQELIVVLAVAGAAGFLVARYIPRAVADAAWRSAARLARRSGHDVLAGRLERIAEKFMHAPACGGCSGCDSKEEPGSETRHSISVEALRRTARR